MRAMQLIVFGGTGATGRALIEQAADTGHTVTAFVRSPDKLGSLRERVRVVTGEVFDEASVAAAIRGHDVVLSALGTRPWRHVDICAGGTRIIARAMRSVGVRRIIVTCARRFATSRSWKTSSHPETSTGSWCVRGCSPRASGGGAGAPRSTTRFVAVLLRSDAEGRGRARRARP